MENMLLVGLSRQMTLERQMDVVANNVANINTTGFKADRSLFEEYLRSPAHEDNFVRADRRVSFVQDRATFHDFAAGPSEQTKNPLDVAIDGNAFLVVQTAAGERRYSSNSDRSALKPVVLIMATLLATTSNCRSSVTCRESPTRSVFSIGGSPLDRSENRLSQAGGPDPVVNLWALPSRQVTPVTQRKPCQVGKRRFFKGLGIFRGAAGAAERCC